MTDSTDEWMPKTRDDWVGLFSDGYKRGSHELRSEQEEEAAKKAAAEAEQDQDKTGKDEKKNDAPKRKSFGERLLGL